MRSTLVRLRILVRQDYKEEEIQGKQPMAGIIHYGSRGGIGQLLWVPPAAHFVYSGISAPQPNFISDIQSITSLALWKRGDPGAALLHMSNHYKGKGTPILLDD